MGESHTQQGINNPVQIWQTPFIATIILARVISPAAAMFMHWELQG
jgi:hypothetical protein